jgi:peptide/nickel transport system permease protein
MGAYIARRLIQVAPVIILVSIIVFIMIRLIPGDPALVLLGTDVTPQQMSAERARMGLDQPVYVQYIIWAGNMIRGDLGNSFINSYPVSQLILKKLPATVQLSVAALLVATLLSFPLGILSALNNGKWPDRLITLYNSLAMGIPSFWLGILLILVFALQLKWLPPSGYADILESPTEGIKYIIMPAVTLGVFISAVWARFIKSSILETIHQDYVRTARSKGLPQNVVITRHVLRNAMIPVITVLGLNFGSLLGGAVITESIFDWPGVGRLLVQSLLTRDYSIVQALILMAVLVYLMVNLVTDLLYGVVDPRISRS